MGDESREKKSWVRPNNINNSSSAACIYENNKHDSTQKAKPESPRTQPKRPAGTGTGVTNAMPASGHGIRVTRRP